MLKVLGVLGVLEVLRVLSVLMVGAPLHLEPRTFSTYLQHPQHLQHPSTFFP